GRRLLIDRSHGAARPAPGRPEIDHHRDFITLNVLVEARRADRRRMAGEERLVAFATPGLGRRSCRRHAVHAVAVRANDVDGVVAHERFRLISPATDRIGKLTPPAPGITFIAILRRSTRLPTELGGRASDRRGIMAQTPRTDRA